MSALDCISLPAATRDALACETPRKGSGGCSPCGAMSAEQRHILALFTCARAMHHGVSAATIASEAELTVNQVRAVLRKGFSSACTREALAKWCGLKVAQKHNRPFLVVDHGVTFDQGKGGGVAPQSIPATLERLAARGRV